VALLAFIERNRETAEWLQHIRLHVRDAKTIATSTGFGPRFLHSTGQAYKGGPQYRGVPPEYGRQCA
jgi:transaldolase/glucose-6-phosphate isomerase